MDGDLYGNIQPASEFNLIGDDAGILNLSDLVAPALNNLIGTSDNLLNPLLGPLADNGGLTQTMALLPGSPAIDAGSNSLAVDPATNQILANDQRGPGFPRIVGQSVEIGAYEFNPLGQTINAGAFASQVYVYGAGPITLGATANSGLPVSFSLISGPATLSADVVTITGAGDVVVQASQPGNTYYSAATTVDESFTIAPAPRTITPAAGLFMVYGGTLPALGFTYTGLVNGDSTASFLGGLTTTAMSSSGVDDYRITQGTLSATGNYTIGTMDAGSLAVTPAPLTVTASNATRVYGAALPALSASYSGFVNGDTVACLTTPPTLTTTATTASQVQPGGYPITASGAVDLNYTISYVPGTLTVTPAPLTISATNATKVYGAAMPALSVGYSGWINGDSTASLTKLPVFTTQASATSPVRAGGYSIIPSGAIDPDYAITYLPGTLMITPARLTITADNAAMVQGSAVPQLAVKYTGFVNGDTAASLTTPPILTTTARPASLPGVYSIDVKNASSPNYTINDVDGSLVVIPAPVSLVSVSIESVRLGTSKKTTQVVVLQFSGALNAGAATSISSYSLVKVPAGKTQKSQPVPLLQSRYNAATNAVMLITRRLLDSYGRPLKLTCNTARLLDSYGHPLSGDRVATLRKSRSASLSN